MGVPVRHAALLLVAFAAIVAPGGAGAEEAPPVAVFASIEPGAATVGDRLRLTLRVERDAAIEAWFPDVVREVAPLEVLESFIGAPREDGGRIVEERVYVLAAFETGDLGVPGLTFSYVDASGDSATVTTDSLPVTIASVIPGDLDESESGPRDIKPPLELPRRIWPLVVAAAVAAAALAAFHYWRKWWRARETGPVEEIEERAVRRRAAHVVAFERLDALERDDPMGRGEMTAFYVAVTGILRLYVRDRFAVDAIDMTTAELAPAMAEARIGKGEVDWTVGFLSHADLAKFAKRMPAPERAGEDLRAAREFVERTRFRGGDADEPAGGGGAEDGGDDAGGGADEGSHGVDGDAGVRQNGGGSAEAAEVAQ